MDRLDRERSIDEICERKNMTGDLSIGSDGAKPNPACCLPAAALGCVQVSPGSARGTPAGYKVRGCPNTNRDGSGISSSRLTDLRWSMNDRCKHVG